MNLSNSPTLRMAATNAGVILGTAAYMPPEQAKGKETDCTTDIWAFRLRPPSCNRDAGRNVYYIRPDGEVLLIDDQIQRLLTKHN